MNQETKTHHATRKPSRQMPGPANANSTATWRMGKAERGRTELRRYGVASPARRTTPGRQ